MARYRILSPIFDGGSRYEAGQVVDMPSTFIPSGACEPLDAEAVQAFWNAGPQLCPLVRQQWENLLVTRYPATHWHQVDPKDNTMWKLTGLGAALGSRKATRTMELP
jgi:hypothetical protein